MMRRAKPDYLKDPMALLLMAYNEMLKIRGAGEFVRQRCPINDLKGS